MTGRRTIPTPLRLAEGPVGTPAVLALHSLGLTGDSWQPLASRARATFFAFDQLGHGARRAEAAKDFDALLADAEAILAQLPQGGVHLIGHSMGGCVAASVAARNAARIRSLTIIASPLKGMPQFADRATAGADGGMDEVTAQTLARWFGPTGQDDHPEARRRAEAALRDMAPEGFDAAWHALAGFAGFEALPSICVPTLVCSFPDDLSTPPAVGAAIVRTLAAAGTPVTSHTLSGGGHMGVLTHAAELCPLLQAHWDAADQPAMEGVRP